MKHILGRIVGYTALYCGVLFGVFVLQFTKGQAFSVRFGSMTVTGRQERTETGAVVPLLPLHIVSNGLDIYISGQNPVYAVDAAEQRLELQVLAYQEYEAERRFSVQCSENVMLSFISEEKGDLDSLRIEASLPENIKKVIIPWQITQNAGIERSGSKLFVRSGKNQYSFTGSFGFNTESDAAQSEEPHLILTKIQPLAYYKTYLPQQELDIDTIPSMVLASAENYAAALDAFASAVIHAGSQALSTKKLTEQMLTAYVAEMGHRSAFTEALESAPMQTLPKSSRTYLSNPFYGNIQQTHTGLEVHDSHKREQLAALIKEHNVEIFEHDELLPFLTDRGSKNSIDNFFHFIETLDGNTLTARQAAGLLAVWLDCTHYYPEKKSLFEELIPLCEKKITDSLLLIDEGLYLSNDGAYIDSIASLASAQILMRYGTIQSSGWQAVSRMLVTSLLRYSGESAGLPVGFTVTGEKMTQLALIADDSRILDAGVLYPLVMPDNTWYPHAQSLALQSEAGIWAWTCTQHIEVLENTARTLLLRIRFPEGQSHYLTLHGIRPFYRIELYGIPFRSDTRFEIYNSSGYAYNANSKILYLKMRHKSEYELIRLSFGAAPQQKPAQPVVQPSPQQLLSGEESTKDGDSSSVSVPSTAAPASDVPASSDPVPETVEPQSQQVNGNE